MYPLSKNPLGLQLFEMKKERPGTDLCSLEARGRMGEPRTDLEKFQVVKVIEVPGHKGHLVEAECPLGATSQAEMSWRQRKSVLVDTSPESRIGHNTKYDIF